MLVGKHWELVLLAQIREQGSKGLDQSVVSPWLTASCSGCCICARTSPLARALSTHFFRFEVGSEASLANLLEELEPVTDPREDPVERRLCQVSGRHADG